MLIIFVQSKGHPCILENPELTRQLTTTVSNTVSMTKNEILASFRQKSSSSQAAPTNANAIRLRNHSSPSDMNSETYSVAPSAPIVAPVASVNPHQIPYGPVAVQNNPFFEHPLVLQQRRQEQQNRNLDNENNNAQQQRLPFGNILQRFQNGNNNNNRQEGQPAEEQPNKENTFQKAPLYVPITPHAFLKFFSL